MEFSNPFLIGSSVLQIKHKPDRQLWQEEGGHDYLIPNAAYQCSAKRDS